MDQNDTFLLLVLYETLFREERQGVIFSVNLFYPQFLFVKHVGYITESDVVWVNLLYRHIIMTYPCFFHHFRMYARNARSKAGGIWRDQKLKKCYQVNISRRYTTWLSQYWIQVHNLDWNGCLRYTSNTSFKYQATNKFFFAEISKCRWIHADKCIRIGMCSHIYISNNNTKLSVPYFEVAKCPFFVKHQQK